MVSLCRGETERHLASTRLIEQCLRHTCLPHSHVHCLHLLHAALVPLEQAAQHIHDVCRLTVITLLPAPIMNGETFAFKQLKGSSC